MSQTSKEAVARIGQLQGISLTEALKDNESLKIDLIITGNKNLYIDFLISQLNLVFEMGNLRPLHHFLGIEVNITPDWLFLFQKK